MKRVAIYIGRFQPLHKGHIEVINHCKKNYDETFVLVGSCNKRRSMKNPFSFEKIARWLVNTGVKVHPLKDYIYDDEKWATQIKDIISDLYKNQECEFTLVGHMKDDSSFYLNMFPEYKLDLLPEFNNGLSATDIRTQMFENLSGMELLDYLSKCVTSDVARDLFKFTETEEFKDIQEEYFYFKKEKEKFKDYPYKDTLKFNCADAVVECNGYVLLIKRKKAPGKGSWALPGGFVNTNETYLHAAKRELLEETGLDISKTVTDKETIGLVFDHPSRGCGIPRITFGAYFDLDNYGIDALPYIKASDDAIEAKWININDLKAMILHDDHMDIIESFVKLKTFIKK